MKKLVCAIWVISLFFVTSQAFGGWKAWIFGEKIEPKVQSEPAKSDDLKIVFEVSPTPEQKQTLDWVTKSGWCWAIDVPWNTTAEQLRDLRKKGVNVVLFLNVHENTRQREAKYKKTPLPDINEIVTRHIKAADGDASKVYWELLLEDDSSGVSHPQELLTNKPKNYADAKKLFDEHMSQVMAIGNKYKPVNLWGLCGYVSAVHDYAATGVDCVILERTNDDVEDIQTGVAFTRGAARQFKCKWGIDISLWWGVIYGCIQNLPDSYHKRNLYLSYFSGAEAMRIEGGNLFYNAAEQKMYRLKDTIDAFGKFTKKYSAGVPQISVAVILPKDHGWMTPPYWRTTNTAWNYAKIPYRQGDISIDGFFAAAFPGSNFTMDAFPFGKYENDNPPASPFALSCITEEFAPSKDDIFFAEPPIPFGRFTSRDQAREVMNTCMMDTSPYRPMGDSRWGDIFDVFTEDVKLDCLKNYKAVVLLGQIKLNDAFKQILMDYTRNGGNLICAAGVLRPSDIDLSGLKMSPELAAGRAWKWQKENYINEPYRYLPSAAASSDVKVLIQSSENEPLVTERKIGAGKIYVCTVPWFEGVTRKMCGPAEKLFDYVIEPLQPVAVKGLPVEWLTTVGSNEYTLVLSNNSGKKWQGEIELRQLPDKYKNCTELLTGQKIKYSNLFGKKKLKAEIPAYDIRIYRWQ